MGDEAVAPDFQFLLEFLVVEYLAVMDGPEAAFRG